MMYPIFWVVFGIVVLMECVILVFVLAQFHLEYIRVANSRCELFSCGFQTCCRDGTPNVGCK